MPRNKSNQGQAELLAGAPKERVPASLQPMLARMGELPRDQENWGFEIKWDGVRALGCARKGRWVTQNRRVQDIRARYPELAALATQLGDRTAVLDGEVVAMNEEGRPSFQRIQRRMTLTDKRMVELRMRDTPVDFMIFDLLHLDGHCVRDLPYADRRKLLESLGLEGPRWHTPPHHVGGGEDLLEAARRQGLEGVVAKQLNSPYKPGGRTGQWIKYRIWQRQEFVIGGWIPGEGSRARRVGSLLVGYYDKPGGRLIFAGGVGSGLKEDDLDFLTRQLKRRERKTSCFEVGGPAGPKARLATLVPAGPHL